MPIRFYSLVILFLGLLFSNTSIKAQVPTLELRQTANGFIASNFNADLRETSLADDVSSLLNEEGDIIAFIISLIPQGFIVLSPEKGISPVISFSTESDFVFEAGPNNTLLSLLQKDMSSRLALYRQNLIEGNLETIKKNQKVWNSLVNTTPAEKNYATQYGPHLTTIWGGVNCEDDTGTEIYVGNYYTPTHYSPGCVATSTSTLMNYYQWPPRGQGSHTNHDNYGDSQGDYFVNFGATTYDWGNMLDEYDGMPSTLAQQQAMGQIAYHCGIAYDMEYEAHGSTSNVSWTPATIDNYFRYSAHYKLANWPDFWPRVEENLENGYLVTFAISATNGAGHAAVCDGYGQDVGQPVFYHMQFGWWGAENGWYDLQGSWLGGGYSIIDGGALDILPDPMFNEPIRSANEKTFTLPWSVSNQLTWDAFEIQESWNGDTWTVLDNNWVSPNYNRTVTQSGNYKYKVRAKVNGNFFLNSFSEEQEVLVARDDNMAVSLDFDGNDAFFVNDNDFDNLDVSDEWTFETWVKINNFHPSSDFDIIMDRKTVFSMYLISDSNPNADYGIRFVSRNSSSSIIASLRSDDSNQALHFGEWAHVAVTRDGTTSRLFINGEQVATSTDSDFNLTASTNALNFGARYWSSAYSRYLVGELDEIRISDVERYLPGARFTPNRNQQHNPDANTLLLLHLDEGSGNSLGDASRHFFDTNLQPSPNYANWSLELLLPVVYSSPLVAKEEKSNIALHWATANETNNKGFDIQRSSGGKIWLTIGNVAANDTGNYIFIDKNPLLATNFYRLKQLDFDGKFEYSKIVSISLDNINTIQLAPNPVNDWLTIKSSSNSPIQNIQLFNYLGKEININWKQESVLDVSILPNGVYFLYLKLEGKVVVKQFIVG